MKTRTTTTKVKTTKRPAKSPRGVVKQPARNPGRPGYERPVGNDGFTSIG